MELPITFQGKDGRTYRKNPNHHKNYTINIDPLIGKPIKVNVLLITKFNGQTVDY